MQCNHMNTILSVDKKAIIKHIDDFKYSKDKTAKNLYTYIMKEGNENWIVGVNEYFKSKEWVFFNCKPSGLRKNQWKQYWLWQMGYYKENKVGCGQCEICRVEKSKEWAVKATAEFKTWDQACFLTLTYNNQNYELNGGYINKANLQSFWKKLRYHLYKETKKAKKIDLSEEREAMKECPEEIKIKYMCSRRKPKDKPIRYIACNEYGERKGRAHAHAVIFNFMPNDLRIHSRDRRGYYIYTSKKLNSIWGRGYVIVGRVNANVAAYVARYNTKKFSKISGKVNGMIAQLNYAFKNADKPEAEEILKNHLKVWKERQESISASSMGYIGSYYWETNKEKIIRDGGIFVNWSKGVHLEKIPKCMQKDYEELYPEEYEWYKEDLKTNGQKQWEEILSKTSLTEEEYIEDTLRKRMKSMKLLKREYNEKPTYSDF